MKIFVVLLMLFGFVVMVSADLPQEPIQRVAPEDFCIMPWNVWPETEFQPEDYDQICKEVYECGFNVSGLLEAKYAHYAKKYNLKTQLLFAMPENVNDDYENIINAWAKNIKENTDKEVLDNMFQIYVRDEPFVKHFEEMFAYGKACRHILGVRPYINFNPNYAAEEVIGKSYESYCDSLIKGAELDFVSYDNYALFNDTGLDEDRFYSNLEEMRNVSLKHDVHFMNVILSVQHFNYGRPDDASIALQGFSSMAYGAKGLSYFTLIAPARGDFRNSPYDRYGHKTDLWYAIRNMNFAIHNLSPVYCNLKNVNVFHVGNVPKLGKGFESSVNLKEIKCSSPVGEANCVVGEFVHSDGTPYVLIVNKNLKYSMFIDKLEFKKGTKITHIMDLSRKNNTRDFSGEDFWLAPGYGVLLKSE